MVAGGLAPAWEGLAVAIIIEALALGALDNRI